MRSITPALTLALACLAPTPANSHPHVFIDMRSSVSFNAQGAVDAIGISWTFDEFYTQFTTDGIDKNGNKKFDPAELQELANSYVRNLKEYRYFTYVELDGKLANTGTPTNARAVISNGQLTFVFRLPFASPFDPASVKIRYTSFDPTYYIDIAPTEKDTVSLVGGVPKTCTHALRKVDTTQPGALALARSIKMMTPADDVLNATTASIVDITCAKTKASS